jgi:hypothetical protein
VWAYTIDRSGGKLMLVSDDGQIAHSHDTEPGANFSVDRELDAQLHWARGRALRIARFGRAGEHSEQALEVPESFGPDIFHIGIHPSADGSVRVGGASSAGSYIAKYDAEGTLVWKQTELRTARRFPFEDSGHWGPGVVPLVSYGLVPLADGSLAVILPKYDGDDPQERALASRLQGVTVLDADGNLRWDGLISNLFSLTPGVWLTADPNGGLVFATGFGDGVRVVAVDQIPGEIHGWLGLRVDYFALQPRALCVDPAGAIYVAVVTGERDDGRLTLCRMRGAEPDATPECASVELSVQPDGQGGPVSSLGMACPVPGKVVLLPGAGSGEPLVLTGVEF